MRTLCSISLRLDARLRCKHAYNGRSQPRWQGWPAVGRTVSLSPHLVAFLNSVRLSSISYWDGRRMLPNRGAARDRLARCHLLACRNNPPPTLAEQKCSIFYSSVLAEADIRDERIRHTLSIFAVRKLKTANKEDITHDHTRLFMPFTCRVIKSVNEAFMAWRTPTCRTMKKYILFVREKVFCWSATQNYIHTYVTGHVDPVNSFPFLVMVYLEIFLETLRYFYWRKRYIDKEL